jgi:hypothetical protein
MTELNGLTTACINVTACCCAVRALSSVAWGAYVSLGLVSAYSVVITHTVTRTELLNITKRRRTGSPHELRVAYSIVFCRQPSSSSRAYCCYEVQLLAVQR